MTATFWVLTFDPPPLPWYRWKPGVIILARCLGQRTKTMSRMDTVDFRTTFVWHRAEALAVEAGANHRLIFYPGLAVLSWSYYFS